MRDPVAGDYSVISPPGSVRVPVCPCPCGLAFVFFAKPNETCFCEIVHDPWCLQDEFWWVLISFPEFFEGFEDFVGFPGAVGPPSPMVSLAFVFPMFCRGFKGGQREQGEPPKNLPISL